MRIVPLKNFNSVGEKRIAELAAEQRSAHSGGEIFSKFLGIALALVYHNSLQTLEGVSTHHTNQKNSTLP